MNSSVRARPICAGMTFSIPVTPISMTIFPSHSHSSIKNIISYGNFIQLAQLRNRIKDE